MNQAIIINIFVSNRTNVIKKLYDNEKIKMIINYSVITDEKSTDSISGLLLLDYQREQKILQREFCKKKPLGLWETYLGQKMSEKVECFIKLGRVVDRYSLKIHEKFNNFIFMTNLSNLIKRGFSSAAIPYPVLK